MGIKVMKSRWSLGLLATVALLYGIGQVWAGEPPSDPILRVETGMHHTKINRIAVDAANQYLVTGSDDKTVRVWELATGDSLPRYDHPLERDPKAESMQWRSPRTVVPSRLEV